MSAAASPTIPIEMNNIGMLDIKKMFNGKGSYGESPFGGL
jgi:hypothetical protein